MNGKKLSEFQFHFPGLLATSPILKQETKKSLIIGDNPIYLISDSFSFSDNVSRVCLSLHISLTAVESKKGMMMVVF